MSFPFNPRVYPCTPYLIRIFSPVLFSLYDRNIDNNNEQKQAVENIVFGTSLPYPYLVFGGPGSGKTNTTVEAIKQVSKTTILCYDVDRIRILID